MDATQSVGSRLVASGYPLALRVRCDVGPPDRRRLPIAVPSLDAFLGGGLPRGAITEVFGGRSSGKTTLAHALVSATIRTGTFVAWIDLPNAFRPERSSERVLWIAPPDGITALRAAEYVLEAGGFQVLILDLGAPVPSRCTVPVSRWLRMARLAARRDVVILVLSAVHVAGPFAALSLEACSQHRRFAGTNGPSPIFQGVESSLHLRRSRYEPPLQSSVGLRAFAED